MVKTIKPPGKGGAKGSSTKDVHTKVRQTVGWYNTHGGMAAQISYPKVAQLLEQLDTHTVGRIFKSMEDTAAELRNPTAWIVNAARNAGAVEDTTDDHASGDGGGAELGAICDSGEAVSDADMDAKDAKVRKTVGWYNHKGNLNERISYPDVAPLLMQLDTRTVGSIFKRMEGKTEEILHPTAWIASAAMKAGAVAQDGGRGGGDWGGEGGGEVGGNWADTNSEVDAKVRKTVGWYNNKGGLAEKISYPEVAPLLNQLDSYAVGAIFKSMEGKTDEIRNPTAWLCNAAKKRGAQ